MPADAAEHSSLLPLCFLWHKNRFHEEGLLGRMPKSFIPKHGQVPNCHTQLFLGSTVASGGQMDVVRCRGSIWSEKSLTFRWQGLP